MFYKLAKKTTLWKQLRQREKKPILDGKTENEVDCLSTIYLSVSNKANFPSNVRANGETVESHYHYFAVFFSSARLFNTVICWSPSFVIHFDIEDINRIIIVT